MPAGSFQSNGEFQIVSGPDSLYGGSNVSRAMLDSRPGSREQNPDGHAPSGNVLLAAEVWIGGDEDVVAASFSLAEGVAVLELRPAALGAGIHHMAARERRNGTGVP